MQNNKTANWAAGAVIAAAGVWLGLSLLPSPPRIDSRLHTAVGETLGAEAIKLANPEARIFVLTRDTVEFQQPVSVAQLTGLQHSLRAAGRPAATVRIYKADPLRVAEVPPGDFFDLLRQGKDTDVFISLLGPPNLADAQVARLDPKKRPKVVAICTGPQLRRVDLKKAFAQQLLHTAIVSRPGAPAQPSSGDTKAAVAQLFGIFTPANLTELDELLTTTKD